MQQGLEQLSDNLSVSAVLPTKLSRKESLSMSGADQVDSPATVKTIKWVQHTISKHSGIREILKSLEILVL